VSHATGAVRFTGGPILYFEYDGTADMCVPSLWETREEMMAHWRGDNPRVWCECGPVAVWEPVEIMCTYGDGHFWRGKACRNCRTLTEGLVPSFGFYDEHTPNDDFRDGEPEWSPWRNEP